jgi:hypothetical protein
MSAFWGAIGSAALSAIGARKTAKAMQGANDLDLAKLRREAEQNGFNPLTVLRATGGQGSTKGPSGGLASGAFFSTFAKGIPNILEANYNKKMKQAQLTNINASTDNLLASTKSLLSQKHERGRHDVPLMVTAYDPTGKLQDFLIPNPEILEFSKSEFTASLTAIATSFALQNNVTIPEAKEILEAIFENRKKNIAEKKSMREAALQSNNGDIVTKKLPKYRDPEIYDKAREFGFLNSAIEFFN